MKIGFIGLGLMGFPMAENVLKKSQPENFTVWNRTVEKSNSFKRANPSSTIGSSPSDVANKSDVVILVLTDDNANEQVMTDLIQANNSTLTVINMSTITPEKSIELHNKVRAKGFRYIEAPVSGTIGPAKQGTLKIYTGGVKELNDEMQSMLLTMGDQVFYIGEIGKASVIKLLINSNLAVYMSILSETLIAGEHLGLDKGKFLDIINGGIIATVASKLKGPNVLKDNFSVAFPFEHMLKDMSYSLSLLDSEKMPLVDVVKKQYESGLNAEKGKDFSAIFNYYKTLYE